MPNAFAFFALHLVTADKIYLCGSISYYDIKLQSRRIRYQNSEVFCIWSLLRILSCKLSSHQYWITSRRFYHLFSRSFYSVCDIQVCTRNVFHSSGMFTSWLLMNLADFHISTSSSSYISKQKSLRWFHADCRGLPNGFLSVSAAFNQPNIIVYQITCWKGKFITKTRIRSKSLSSSSSSCTTLMFCPINKLYNQYNLDTT